MPRIRTIKPTFFLNEKLADLPPLCRLVFVGLWTLADREGRLEDRPKRIKAELFPWDDADPEDVLGQLDRAGFIQRYSIDGDAFISIPGFGKHQRPHPKEPKSEIPRPPNRDKPCKETASREKVNQDAPASIVHSQETPSQTPETPSLQLVPDPLEQGVQEVFAYWRERTGGGGPEKPGTQQASHIRARLRENRTVEDLERVVDGAMADIKNWPGRVGQLGIHILFRGDDSVRKFMILSEFPNGLPQKTARGSSAL